MLIFVISSVNKLTDNNQISKEFLYKTINNYISVSKYNFV